MARNNHPLSLVMGFILILGNIMIFSLAHADEIRYDRANKRDPFAPLVGPRASHIAGGIVGKESFHLEGVVFDPKKGSYAIIDGAIYREGESIDGAKLVNILPDRVVILQESSEVVVWLREEILEPNQKKEKSNAKK